ncbi:MAG: peptidase T [Planctomycetota bacterium]|nr:peptidase T [Planctomycetota bacterium]
MNIDRLLNRFIKYVQVDTRASASSETYPSTPGQIELGEIVREELQAMGAVDVRLDEHGILVGTIPSNVEQSVPVIAFNSHFDTSPEASGKNVRPNVIRNYSGGDLVLPGDPSRVIREEENPELLDLHGCTLITTDGTTLLGGDDKAGIAIIMEMAESLLEDQTISHGEIRLLFTCDEEIGHGIDHVDVEALGAEACYTVDGGGKGMVDVETFSADGAEIVVKGVNIHPSIGKDRMVNALRAAGRILDRLPIEQSPERTDGRDGFIHPYVVGGGVDEVKIDVLLRSFDTPQLEEFADQLREICAEVETEMPGIEVQVRVFRQYRNLGDGLKRDPRVVDFAVQAHQRLGLKVEKTIIRGGTDGSGLTEKGLPTPNLSSGQHNQHSPLEWACLDEMEQACRVVTEIVKIWAEKEA